MSSVIAQLPVGALPELRELEQFLFMEARMLDEKRFAEWRDLFTEDGTYWAPTRHDQASPDERVSLFFDDRKQMAARIRRLESPDAHVQQPVSHTVHMVTNVEVVAAPGAADLCMAHSTFSMAEYRHTDQRTYAGRVTHTLRRIDGALRIAQKKVVLVNCHVAHTAMAIYF